MLVYNRETNLNGYMGIQHPPQDAKNTLNTWKVWESIIHNILEILSGILFGGVKSADLCLALAQTGRRAGSRQACNISQSVSAISLRFPPPSALRYVASVSAMSFPASVSATWPFFLQEFPHLSAPLALQTGSILGLYSVSKLLRWYVAVFCQT